VDFSDASRAALRYAAAIADHFGARLTVLTVDDPLLAEVAATTGRVPSLRSESERELRKLVSETLPPSPREAKLIALRVEVGRPAAQILQAARETGAELIVMGSRGRSGMRKMFFGSTTERVLRETTVPVLVTPPDHAPVGSLENASRSIHRILAPVDLTLGSPRQVRIAAGLASALSVPLILEHVIEPVFVPPRLRDVAPGSDAARSEDVERRLASLAWLAGSHAVETLIVSGDAAEEIVKLAETRNAGVIVMGLHSSELFGPRMGSVTYRVLCQTRALVLALPPKAAETSAEPVHATALAQVVV
jgi:nucleotide-binding universal stress UspA family protein